jgi:hypothetical protein
MPRILISEVGKVYGRLTVLSRGENSYPKKNAQWLCKCECGKEKLILGYNLRNGHSTSCGCQMHRLHSENGKWSGHGEISGTYFGNLQRGAVIRKMDFKISIEEVWDLFLKQNRECALSGILLILHQNPKDRNATASLDRIDSTKGYVTGNIQWIHKDLNNMKLDFSQEEFVNYCKLIAKRFP